MNLRLLQLGDSALPIGGFSHSWGLEAAIDRGRVRDAQSLENWTRLWLQHVLGLCEAVVVAAVGRAVAAGDWHVAVQANDFLWASLTPPTLRHASRDMGEQLLALAETWPWSSESAVTLRRLIHASNGPQEWHHAPVFATLAATAGATSREAIAVYLHQAALGIIGAGVRAVPIGHTHGQQILARLHSMLDALAQELAERDLATAGACSPAYEVLCHAQSRLYTRLFRS